MRRRYPGGGTLILIWLIGGLMLGTWLWMQNLPGSCDYAAEMLYCIAEQTSRGLAPIFGWFVLAYGALAFVATVVFVARRTLR